MANQTSELNTYYFDRFTVQSYLDEETTRKLYEFILENKIMGRTAPPRKGFMGMVGKLLWEKKFIFEGKLYLVQGGGERLAIFERIAVHKQKEAKKNYRRCIICEMRHPDSDLHETDEGPMCTPCYDVWFPKCPGCGERLELPEGMDPDDGPFYCDDCAENEY